MPAADSTPSLTDLIARVERAEGALAECWDSESRECHTDPTIVFGKGYDFEGLDCAREELRTAHGWAMVWPSQLGGKAKWSAYHELDGSLWFEQFDGAQAAKERVASFLFSLLHAVAEGGGA